VAVDPLTLKVFVCDGQANRVLRYSSTEAMQSDGAPEAVLGQPDEFASAPHTSATGLREPRGIAMDHAGRLWVADTGNHRVLRFDNASSLATGAVASGFIGQVNATSAVAGTTENRLNSPWEVAVDQSGRLWVSDTLNNRVLRWDSPVTMAAGTPANAVLGQSNFTSAGGSAAASGLKSPRGLALEHSSGVLVRLWVADTNADRVLAYSSPASKANGAAADKIFGASTFTTGSGGTTRSTFDAPASLAMEGTTLWVSDTNNYRVLRFLNAGSKANGADADAVLGQFGFTERDSGSTPDRLRTPLGIAVMLGRLWVADLANKRIVRHDAASTKISLAAADGTLGLDQLPPGGLPFPQASAIDPISGKLFVCDNGRHRVTRYASARALQSGAMPEAVFGQPDMSTWFPGTTAAKMSHPNGLTIDRLGNLWVADSGNSRVLQFAGAANLPSGAAAVRVFGQPGFTTFTDGLSVTQMQSPFGLATEAGTGPGGATLITRLWVVDGRNNRVLRFDNAGAKANGAAANGVLLQSSLTSKANLTTPTGVCISPAGRLFVLIFNENRVLWFDNAASLANGAAAHGVLGQPDLVSTAVGGGFHGMWKPEHATLDPFSGQLWVTQDNLLQRYTPQGLLELWRLSQFGIATGTGNAANDADPDGDGVANIMEYLTSQNPKAAGGIGSSEVVGLTRDLGLNAMVVDLRLLTTYDSRVKLTLQSSFDPAAGWTALSTRTGTAAWTGTIPMSSQLSGGRTRFNFNTGVNPDINRKAFFRLKAEELP
jgi:sugar lactone lactonase YvrE